MAEKKSAPVEQAPTSKEGAVVTEETEGKVIGATNTATQAHPIKVKCDKETSCDATYPWGSWES